MVSTQIISVRVFAVLLVVERLHQNIAVQVTVFSTTDIHNLTCIHKRLLFKKVEICFISPQFPPLVIVCVYLLCVSKLASVASDVTVVINKCCHLPGGDVTVQVDGKVVTSKLLTPAPHQPLALDVVYLTIGGSELDVDVDSHRVPGDCTPHTCTQTLSDSHIDTHRPHRHNIQTYIDRPTHTHTHAHTHARKQRTHTHTRTHTHMHAHTDTEASHYLSRCFCFYLPVTSHISRLGSKSVILRYVNYLSLSLPREGVIMLELPIKCPLLSVRHHGSHCVAHQTQM